MNMGYRQGSLKRAPVDAAQGSDPSDSMILEEELGYFEQEKARLLAAYAGKYVLIKGREIFGTFDTVANAYAVGVAKFGREPFLVRRVTEVEEQYRNHALALGLIHARI